jgi:serine protease inhibitor
LSILVNTIYFKAQWDIPFTHEKTYNNVFTGFNKIIKAPFMHNTNYYQYADNKSMQYLKLSYTDLDYALIVALPRATQPNESIKALSDLIKNVKSLFNLSYKSANVNLVLPKFEHRQRYNLVDAFQQMGVIDLFSNGADLSLISKNAHLSVSKIIHEAVVKIDEEGTEAAAATAMVMTQMAAMPPKNLIDFIANHTFYYAIVHLPYQIILFNGIFNG